MVLLRTSRSAAIQCGTVKDAASIMSQIHLSCKLSPRLIQRPAVALLAIEQTTWSFAPFPYVASLSRSLQLRKP